MAHGDDVEKGEASRKRLRLPDSERAKKKVRPTENISKLSRKRAWIEVTETEYLNDDHDSKRKVLRVGSLKKHSGDGDKLVEDRESRGSEPSTQESVSPSRETGVAQEPDLPQRKWKRKPKVAHFGGLESNSGPSGSCLRGASGDHQDASEEHLGTRSAMDEENEGKQKQGRENEVVRKVLQTVHLEESRVGANKHSISEQEKSSIDLDIESADIVSSLEETALNGRDRKRREVDLGEESPPRRFEKKLRIDVAGAEGSHRSGERGTGGIRAHTNTWKRLKRHNKENSTAASEDMKVSISEAWKRLRDWKDTETSGSSVNEDSDSDLSMHSCPSITERIEGRSKKARYESPLPSVGKKWKRHNRERKQRSFGKRQRDGNGCESSGSSGSDMAQSSYLHNRKWKRPRHENLMSLRRQTKYDVEARKRSRRRVQGDASERLSKWPRK